MLWRKHTGLWLNNAVDLQTLTIHYGSTKASDSGLQVRMVRLGAKSQGRRSVSLLGYHSFEQDQPETYCATLSGMFCP
jgi:hypothetical protein